MPFVAAAMLAALGRASAAGEAGALDDLRAWLALPAGERPSIAEQEFARVPLSAAAAAEAGRMLWDDHAAEIRRTRVAELEAHEMRSGNSRLRFETVDFPPDGDQPASSRRSLFLSMHGGGRAPAEVNDSQWRNQVKLADRYRPSNAVYVAPRAPADSAAMWSVPAVDACFDRLIETMIVLENVDPDQVYLMGYSAGGDGAYQLAPRFADRLAAAAAMAGHPNDSSPLGLRNLPFTIHVGQNDRAYGRNNVAITWRDKLAALKSDDPAGYEHVVHVHEGKGHWMDMEDRVAIPWMQAFRRQPLPQRVVWRQGHATHPRFYWLAAAADSIHVGDEVVASRDGATIDVTIRQGKPRVVVRLNDAMLDLDSEVTIRLAGRPVYAGRPPRTVAVIEKTIRERGDPASIFSAEIELPADTPAAADVGPVAGALARSGDNRPALESLLAATPHPRRRGLEFLLANMPDRDLQEMPVGLLAENVESAYAALDRAPWRDRIDEALFLNEILPYCALTERRDSWRREMHDRCLPLIEGITTPAAAAAALNKQLFPLIKVRYSKRRPLVDPSPAQAMESGMASCTGLSIVLVAACRSVAIPARFVGIPAWPGNTGNHSWVEVWDGDWHFTGAAEPAGDRLDEAWFTGRAAGAMRDVAQHAIHAASFARRPERFPLPWHGREDLRPWAVNVTDRYTRRSVSLPEGRRQVLLRVLAEPAGDRVAAEYEIRDAAGASLQSGRTNDERFDMHDDVPLLVPVDAEVVVSLSWEGRRWSEKLPAGEAARVTFIVPTKSRTDPGNP